MTSPISKLNAMELRGAPESDSDVSRSVTGKGGKSNRSSGSTVAKKKRGASDSLSERFSEEALAMREAKRRSHEMEMKVRLEEIALKRQQNELLLKQMEGKTKWDELQSKKDFEMKDLQYRFDLMDKLKDLLDKGYSYEQIAELIPSMIEVFPGEEKKKYRGSLE